MSVYDEIMGSDKQLIVSPPSKKTLIAPVCKIGEE